MDFSRLPDPVILKIFDYLPLEDCVRVGLVDKTFRRFSQLAVSRTKSLDLDDVRFLNLTGYQLGAILASCSPNLERIKFPSRDFTKYPWARDSNDLEQRIAALYDQRQQLASTFADYHCPRLIEIDFGQTSIESTIAIFEQLIRDKQKMESLIWHCYDDDRNDSDGQRLWLLFLDILTNNNLKKLGLYVYKDAEVETLIGRCLNLKELDLETGNCYIATKVLDKFFGSIPQVENVSLCITESNRKDHYYFEHDRDVVNFWNLPLTSLSISYPDNTTPGDSILYKVAESFPNLKKLHLDTVLATSDYVAALTALQELEILELTMDEDHGSDDDDETYAGDQLDEGISQLAYCNKLRKLNMDQSKATGGSLVNLLRSCPQLEHIVMKEITQVANSEEAADNLGSLAGITQRKITVEFRSWDVVAVKAIWDSEPVKDMIGMLEEKDGLKIKFSWRDMQGQ